MSENLKIRFRLPNGEEFEAEGPQEFIDSQRTYFLNLIGRGASSAGLAQVPATIPVNSPLPAITTTLNSIPNAQPIRQKEAPTVLPVEQKTTFGDKKRLWEQLLKREGELLILRRKAHLSAAEAAILILAGACYLLGADAYRAILLSKSLQESGFDAGRLDRLLARHIKEDYLAAQGSKRSRSYRLSQTGFVRAFVLAEKRVGETL